VNQDYQAATEPMVKMADVVSQALMVSKENLEHQQQVCPVEMEEMGLLVKLVSLVK
jgi:hypothetical protein